MKQIDLPATQPEPTGRAAAGTSNGNPASDQRVSCAELQGAQTVVAAAVKKAPARADHRECAAGGTGGKPEQPGSDSAVDNPVSAAANTGNADAEPGISSHADPIQPVSKRLRARAGSGTAPGMVGEGASHMRGAVVFEAATNGMEPAPPKPRRRDPRHPQEQDDIAGSAWPEQELQSGSPAIPGVDDRVPWMALTVGAAMPTLRAPQPAAQKAIGPLKPKSRAECQRRCGFDGFCDPSSEVGCGGIHCGRK
jgi:hypothetical protein